jgi:hypothetical protein
MSEQDPVALALMKACRRNEEYLDRISELEDENKALRFEIDCRAIPTVEKLRAEVNRLTYELDKSRADHMRIISTLESKLAKATAALKWYANHGGSNDDRGQLARDTLAEIGAVAHEASKGEK